MTTQVSPATIIAVTSTFRSKGGQVGSNQAPSRGKAAVSGYAPIKVTSAILIRAGGAGRGDSGGVN